MTGEHRTKAHDIVNISAGDNLLEIGNGAIRRIGELLDIDVANQSADSGSFSDIVDAIDRSLVIDDDGILRSTAWSEPYKRDRVIDIIKSSGFLRPVKRSLCGNAVLDDNAVCVIGADTGSLMERSLTVARNQGLGAELVILVGNRLMDSAIDLVNPGVRSLRNTGAQKPYRITEATYAGMHIMHQLEKGKKLFDYIESDSQDSLEIAKALFIDRDEEGNLMGEQIVCSMAGGLGLQLACKLRIAGRSIYGDTYDSDPVMPNIFVSASGSRLAENEDQLRDPAHFENPTTVARSIASTFYWISRANVLDQPV